MNLFRKVAVNTIIQIVSKIIIVSLAVLTTILLTGYLGKEGYGEYVYVITLAALFSSLADWGTLTIGVREVSKKKENQGKLLANIFFLRLFLSLMAALLLLVFSFFIPVISNRPGTLKTAIGTAFLIVVLLEMRVSFEIVFRAWLQMQKTALAEITASALTFFFSWLVIKKGLGLESLILAVVGANFFAALGAGFLALKTVKYHFQFDWLIIKKFMTESLPMGAILLMFTVDNKIDTLILGAVKGSEAVGIYGLSHRIYDVLILGAAYLMNALLPVISQFADLDKFREKLKLIYQKTFAVLLMAGVVVLVVVLVFAPLAIQFLTRQRYSEFVDSVGVLRIFSFSLFIAYFNHLTGYTIVALGKQRPYFWIALGSLVFNLIANLLIIPRFSYWGAAWITVLNESLIFLVTSVFIGRFLKTTPSLFSFLKTAKEFIRKRGKIF